MGNKPWWIKDLQEVFPNIAPAMVAPDLETLIAFGDQPARWFPAEKILKNVGYCGEKGHWTFPNVIPGQIQAEGVMLVRMNADLMFENEDMTQVYVSARVRDPLTKRWIEAPRCAFEMLMFKTEWGWDRKTSVGNLEACMQHPEVVEKLMPHAAIREKALRKWCDTRRVELSDGSDCRWGWKSNQVL